MSKIILCSILLLSFIIPTQRNAPDPSGFVDSISLDYNIRYLYESTDELEFISEDNKKEFITKCSKYIAAAELKTLLNKKNTTYKWDQSKLKNVVCLSSNLDPRLKKQSGVYLSYLSSPLFDKTGKVAIVKIFQRIIYDNPDISYGSINIYVFQLKNNKWKEVINYINEG